MYEMMIGVPPFNDESVEKIFENIQNMKMDWPPIGKYLMMYERL